jgi:hypothetical protein
MPYPLTLRAAISIFEGVWLDAQRVVAVQPLPWFLAYFESAKSGSPNHRKAVLDAR